MRYELAAIKQNRKEKLLDSFEYYGSEYEKMNNVSFILCIIFEVFVCRRGLMFLNARLQRLSVYIFSKYFPDCWMNKKRISFANLKPSRFATV